MADNELQDLIDVIGWHDKADPKDYDYAVFKWMREATSEIRRLQNEVESLSRTLQSRTEHLV